MELCPLAGFRMLTCIRKNSAFPCKAEGFAQPRAEGLQTYEPWLIPTCESKGFTQTANVVCGLPVRSGRIFHIETRYAPEPVVTNSAPFQNFESDWDAEVVPA